MSIRTALCAGVAVLAVAATGCTAAHNPIARELAPAPTAKPAVKPACAGTVVTVMWNESTDCDVNPPQRLDVVFDESFWGEAWGGDASMAAVDQECADMGGRDLIGFSADHPDALVCEGVDY